VAVHRPWTGSALKNRRGVEGAPAFGRHTDAARMNARIEEIDAT